VASLELLADLPLTLGNLAVLPVVHVPCNTPERLV
jgi:hypothetical protein